MSLPEKLAPNQKEIYEEECIIKRSWEFASIVQFLFAFGKVIHLDQQLVMERLEPLLLLEAIIDPVESYNLRLISSIHACLLNQLGRKTSTACKGPRSWITHLRKELHAQREFYQVVHLLQTFRGDEEISLYDCTGMSIIQNMDYASLRPTQRLILLKYLCERVAETSESIRNYIQRYVDPKHGANGVNRRRCIAAPPKDWLETNNIRSRPLGKDAQGNQFIYFANQEPNSKGFWIYTEDGHHSNLLSAYVLSTAEELSVCMKGFENSEATRDRFLAQKLREIYLSISSVEDTFPTEQLFRNWEELAQSHVSMREQKPAEEADCQYSENALSFNVQDSGQESENFPARKCRKLVSTYVESDEDSIASDDSSFEISSDTSFESDEDSNIGFAVGTVQNTIHPVYYPLTTFSCN